KCGRRQSGGMVWRDTATAWSALGIRKVEKPAPAVEGHICAFRKGLCRRCVSCPAPAKDVNEPPKQLLSLSFLKSTGRQRYLENADGYQDAFILGSFCQN